MDNYTPQVSSAHYSGGVYRAKERWASYWHQLDLVRRFAPKTLLEVGPGLGVVTHALRGEGVTVTTCDIDPARAPDAVASVTALPFADASFDAALAAEVLEHIRWEDVERAFAELRRVARADVIISVPHPGYVFLLAWKLPILPRITLWFQISFFWWRHEFNGEHYWELGTRGYPVRRLVACARSAGLSLVGSYKYDDDPVHRFFVFAKA